MGGSAFQIYGVGLFLQCPPANGCAVKASEDLSYLDAYPTV